MGDKDSIVHSMMMSYHNAIHDPDNELAHLFEIRDALQTFYREKKALLS